MNGQFDAELSATLLGFNGEAGPYNRNLIREDLAKALVEDALINPMGAEAPNTGNKTMNENGKVSIGKLKTGVPGLDVIAGGGLPEYSFNLIAGEPGSGKTTLAHQIMFANAAPTTPALYFTVLGEPAIKMLRYQQQFDFFDRAKLEQEFNF